MLPFELLTRSQKFQMKSFILSFIFLHGLQLQNDKKNNLRTSKVIKDLSQIEFFIVAISRELLRN